MFHDGCVSIKLVDGRHLEPRHRGAQRPPNRRTHDCVSIDASRGRVLRHLPPFQSSGQLRTMFAAACRSRLRTSKMRLVTFIVAMIAASAPAGAQGWREYQYPNEGFTVAFPGDLKVEITS